MEKPAASAPELSRLARDSAVVGAATIASRLLGFARDVLIARLLGGGPVADAISALVNLGYNRLTPISRGQPTCPQSTAGIRIGPPRPLLVTS